MRYIQNLKKALKALRELAAKPDKLCWVNKDSIRKARTLADAIQEFGWEIDEVELDDCEYGDVTAINFIADTMGSENEMFGAMAPAVEDGSYIEMTGDEGERWRWVFEAGGCKTVKATVTF